MNALPIQKLRRAAAGGLAPVSLAFLTGCRGAPSINVVGSFFPAWMLCIGLGVLGSLAARRLFVKLGIEPHLKPRQLIYFCLWALIAIGSWLLFFRS